MEARWLRQLEDAKWGKGLRSTTAGDDNRRMQRQIENTEWRAATAGVSSSRGPPSKTSGIVHVPFDPPLPGVWHPPPPPPPPPLVEELARPRTATQQQQQRPLQQAHRLLPNHRQPPRQSPLLQQSSPSASTTCDKLGLHQAGPSRYSRQAGPGANMTLGGTYGVCGPRQKTECSPP